MDQPSARTASAEAIKAYAANGGHGGPAPANVALAAEAGVLCAFVDMLCDERDRLLKELQKHDGRHANATAPKGCSVAELSLGDSTVWVAYEYTPGQPGQMFGPPEKCYEAIDAEVIINDVYINGCWMRDINEIAEGQIDAWVQTLIDRHADDASEEAAARAEYEYERRQERLRDMQWP